MSTADIESGYGPVRHRARRPAPVRQKAGFKAEGVLRDALYWDGEYVDATVMSILETEWA